MEWHVVFSDQLKHVRQAILRRGRHQDRREITVAKTFLILPINNKAKRHQRVRLVVDGKEVRFVTGGFVTKKEDGVRMFGKHVREIVNIHAKACKAADKPLTPDTPVAMKTSGFKNDLNIESVKAFCEGGDAKLVSMEVYQLNAKWDN